MENLEQRPRLMALPDNYAFNNLIQDFAGEIKGDDVKVIKRRFEGIVPSDVQTGLQIVQYLRDNGYVSDTNIIYLQQIIRILGKRELLQKTIDFAKCNERIPVLYFRETTIRRSGFKAIKIHVEGHGRLNHEELDELRHKISKIVLASPEDVSFAGIEETNSILITIVLPDMYCEALEMLLRNAKKHYHFLSLRKFGVDRIEVLGKWYEICEKEKHFNERDASETELNVVELPTEESSNTKCETNVEEKSDEVVKMKRNKNLVLNSNKKSKQSHQLVEVLSV